MKKFYFFFAVLFAAVSAYAQVTFTNLGGTLWQIAYIDAPQWTTFDPQGASTVYLHTWINSGENSTGSAYSDDWNNSTVSLTWDSNHANASGSNGAFVGTIDLASHNFNAYGGVLPNGATVTELNFIIKDAASNSTRKSADMKGTTFGFKTTTISTLSTLDMTSLKSKSAVVDGVLYSSKKGNINIDVIDFSGRVLKSFKVNNNGNPINLGLSQKGVYMLKLSDWANSEVVKFKY